MYDELNNLRFVIPPLAVANVGASGVYLNITKYEPAFHDTTYIVCFRNIYNMMSANKGEVWSDPVLKRYL